VSAATSHRPAPADVPAAPLKDDHAPANDPVPEVRGTRKRNVILIGVLVLAAVAGLGYHLLTDGHESTDDAEVEADVVPLASRVNGQVLRVLVKENALVKAGDPLVEIDPADYEIRVHQAEGERVSAQAQADAADAQALVAEAAAKGGLSTARAGVSASNAAVSTADAQVAAAKAAITRAEADVTRAHQELSRAQQLRAANAIPQQRLDNALTASASAEAALDLARAQLASAEQSKHMAVSRVAEAQGQLDSSAPIDSKIAVARANAALAHGRVTTAEAALEQAKLMLSYTHLVAPHDGRVAKLGVHAGQLVAAGAPIAQLVPNETYVVANFKETQLQHMRPGQKVEIEIDALDGKREGTVESIAAGTGSRFALLPPDNASGNYVKVVQRVPVRIALSNPAQDVQLRAGLSADVTVFTK